MRLAVAAFAGVLLSWSAFADPPPGAILSSPEHKWWECFKQPGSTTSCCSEADGHVLSDSDWRFDPVKGDHYQVLIENKWWDVPPKAVLNDFAKCGPEPNTNNRPMAKAWYKWDRGINGLITYVDFRCFKVGDEY